MNKHYAITGRLCGDDEDTLYIIEAEDADKAQAIFQERILSDNHYSSLEQWFAENKEYSEEDSGIFLNSIVESDTPVRVIYSNF